MRVLALAMAVLTLGVPSIARAQAPGTRIELRLEGEWSEPLRHAVHADLAASLRDQGLELVGEAEGAEGVVARIEVSAPSDARRACRVRIDDAITGKHVERMLDLSRVPADGWSVAIAAGSDELLRASWAELAIPDAPPPAIEPPAAVTGVVRERIVGPIVGERVAAALSRPALSLGARAAGEGWLGGLTLFGGDLVVRLYLVERFGLEIALGGRAGLDAEADRGRVRSWMLGAELGAVFLLVPAPSPVRLEAFAVARTGWLVFDAEANEGAIAEDAAGGVFVARAGLRVAAAIDRAELGLALGAGAPIVGREAIDGEGEAVVGLTGLEIHAALSVLVEVMP